MAWSCCPRSGCGWTDRCRCDGDGVVADALRDRYRPGVAGRVVEPGRRGRGGHRAVVPRCGRAEVDVVLGADITYDGSVVPALVATLCRLLDTHPHAAVYLAATQRNRATFAIFLDEIKICLFIFNRIMIDFPNYDNIAIKRSSWIRVYYIY